MEFIIGARYRNRQREYEVVAIQGDQMTVRYDDGTTGVLTKSIQQRIVNNIALQTKDFDAKVFSVFADDDLGYLDWLARNPEGFVLNTTNPPSSSYLKLHTALCGTISETPARGLFWTRDYAKVCSESKEEVERWARRETGGRLDPCGLCHP